MPTEPPAASVRSRQKTPTKNKDTTPSKQNPRTSHQKHTAQSPKSHRTTSSTVTQVTPQDEISRLKEIVSHLQSEHKSQSIQPHDMSAPSDLRWRINKLEKDKLELTTKYNEEVSKYEGEVARLRASVERGEAQRQNLEYEIAVVRRDATAERNMAEEKVAALYGMNEQLKVHAAELQQRMSDLEKALDITRHARDEDQQALQLELEERDRLLLGANAEIDLLNAEKKRLDSLLQEQEDTLVVLRRKMEQLQREKERDGESLRRQAGELEYVSEREQRFKRELEIAQQKVKTLEESVESERAAHLESKFNSEIIQLRIRDLEAALQVEKSAQMEALSSLELMKQKFGEVERAYEQERDKAKDSLQQLAQLEKDYLSKKAELGDELKGKNKVMADLIEKIQSYEKQEAASRLQLEKAQMHHTFLEESYESFRRELEQILHRCAVSDPRVAEEPGEGKHSPSVLMDSLKRTLTHYQDNLERTARELQDLKKMYESATQECDLYEEMNRTLKKNIEEAHIGLARANEELLQLRSGRADSEAQAGRAQADLCDAQRRWEAERERAAEAEREIHRLSQLYQKDSQEKLTFLHDLYQRLVAGCVLIKQPQGLLGSFSWPELCAVLQEHADALTSDLSRANEKISHLEFVCQNKSEAVRELQQTQETTFSKLAEQMKKREGDWQMQRKDLEEHYSSLTTEVQARAQKWQRTAEEAQEKVESLERIRNQMAMDLACLQNLLPQTRREGAALLAACALLAGALGPLYSQLCALTGQKALLLEQVGAGEAFEGEIRSLVDALTAENKTREEPAGQAKRPKGRVRAFRKCAIAVMAANRLRRLGQRSQVLFTLDQGLGDLPALCVSTAEARSSESCSGQRRAAQQSSMALQWLRSRDLLALVLSSMGELQDAMSKEEAGTPSSGPGVLAAARMCFAKLMERLMVEMDSTSRVWCREKGALTRRLGQGLHKLSSKAPQSDMPATLTRKRVVAELQQRILEFTQRLHSAEVERRSLRLEVAQYKRSVREVKKEADRALGLKERQQTAGVPVERFDSMCQELSSALEREEQAQALLHEQAQQLHQLGLRLELHSGEEAEKDRTLDEAVKSLSEAKMELKRKDQSLRQLGRHLSQLQQDKRQLEESIRHAESALRMAAKSKDSLAGYMRSVEGILNDVKERILLSRAAATREDFTLQLPRVHLDMAGSERLMGGPEVAACQSFISSFMDLYQMACSRMALLEKEISSHQTRISALKSELQDACLRENQCFVPVPEPPLSASPLSLPELPLSFATLHAEADISLSETPGNSRSKQPGSSLSGSLKTTRRLKKSSKSSSGGSSRSK
ncbi:coiled-coil domain-containing protein 171-like [Megalops cyprinoides]|uniref:coiled-coil domain-containing protein 171-like n=1 Tax=Megalops cyprinoides TaxID=118141 RepID=UPI00186464BA|nr:coiled-coil domain-containing protein 171-like [Megalops cyprinoides]